MRVADSLIQSERDGRTEERAGVAVDQTADLQLGQVLEVVAALTHGEHQPDLLGRHTTGDEAESQCRGLIQPLRVVEDTQHRLLLGYLRHQTEHGQGNEEPIRGGACAQTEHDFKGLALRAGQFVEAIEQRLAELLQTGVGHLHL